MTISTPAAGASQIPRPAPGDGTEEAPPATAREAEYRERSEAFEAQAASLQQRSHRISNVRGLAFAAGLVGSLVAAFGSGGPIAGAIGLAGFVGFIAAVALHSRLLDKLDEVQRWARVNRDAEHRCGTAWTTLPITGAVYGQEGTCPYADDLDLFGAGSLFQRLCVAHTRYGQDTLAAMLSAPADLRELHERQAAVRSLSDALEWRQKLETHAIALQDTRSARSGSGRGPVAPPDPEPFLRWVEAAPRLLPRRALRVLAWALPMVTLSAVLAASLFGAPSITWAIPLALQVFMLLRHGQAANETFGAVGSSQGHFVRYGGMLGMLESMDFEAPKLAQLRSHLAAEGHSPSQSMRRFTRIMSWFDLRHNGLIHPVANILLLWDLHCVIALERWKSGVGSAARSWFDAVGTVEALSSFAGLLHDDPSVTLPTVGASEPCFLANGLSHPLLHPAKRVTNDVRLAGAGQALLVTGSNMSGKSTLLRSMGLAAVMAYAGAPVCARQLRLSEAAVRTSIRVRDSLQAGVSHFYAEIEKLKRALDAVDGPRPVLFLLDEILHGTNSTERQVGARWILAELLRHGAIGAVSTHDIELCRLDAELMPRVQQVHFQESTHAGRMHFDYTLRPGPVCAGNALRLMRMVGLGVPLPGESEG